MKKRAAMIIAAALVSALLAGTVAFTSGIIGPQAQAGSVAAVAPHVRTIHHTVTVHRQARRDPAPVIRTIAAPAQVSAPRSASFGEDDGYEGEGEGESSGGFHDD